MALKPVQQKIKNFIKALPISIFQINIFARSDIKENPQTLIATFTTNPSSVITKETVNLF
jgi:hypothetical protein